MSKRPELVIGFVGPAGARLDDLVSATSSYLKQFRYEAVEIRLSRLLENYAGWTAPHSESEDQRILHRQKMGHAFRDEIGNGAALALAALVAIREERIKLSKAPDQPADSVAYLLNQLKHPNEVALLRQVYGSSFVLVAGHASKKTRIATLVQRIAASEKRTIDGDDEAKATNIISIDDSESGTIGPDDMGQNTRATYPLADMFSNIGVKAGEYSVNRFIDLLFGHPFHTPQPDEVAMYHAHAGALRSSDENRQVGAVIVRVKREKHKTSNVDLVAAGMNEVPKRGGGFYWDGDSDSPDARDQWLIAYAPNDDRALRIKKGVLTELLEIFKRMNWFKEPFASTQTPDLLKDLLNAQLKGTQFMNIGEFQRQVHAEMAAIIDAARRGVSVDQQSMYVTTFPCHNCAKHIIAAGIRQVVYLEPYPKSRAEMLHAEEIVVEPVLDQSALDESKVNFLPYSGVAPRQYQRLFSMSGRGAKNGYSLRDWGAKRSTLSPQYLSQNAAASYLLNERQSLKELPSNVYKWDSSIICPN